MKQAVAPRLAPDEPIFDDKQPAFSRGPAKRPAEPVAPVALPKTVDEAEARYFARYGWQLIEAVFGNIPQPATVAEWIGLAEETRDYLALPPGERLARRLEDLAAALRRKDEAYT